MFDYLQYLIHRFPVFVRFREFLLFLEIKKYAVNDAHSNLNNEINKKKTFHLNTLKVYVIAVPINNTDFCLNEKA